MDQSFALLSAEVHFLDTSLSLIHIPLPLYNYFLAPLLQLLAPAQAGQAFPKDPPLDAEDHLTRSRRPWAYAHPFVNVSVTPIECSVVCSTVLVAQLFLPVRDSLASPQREQVIISTEEFICIQVDGEGLDAGQRVLELSSPLAMNGISIFFITTYFSDYILVPLHSRTAVTAALEARGFAFHADAEAFVNIASPLVQPLRSSTSSSTSSPSAGYFPLTSPLDATSSSATTAPTSPTPPPSSLSELQLRTFALLSDLHVQPTVDAEIRLIQCAGRKDTLRAGTGAHASAELSQMRLQLGLLKCLYTVPRARFLSVTLTDSEPASIVMERSLLANFESVDDGRERVLIGSTDDVMVGIMLDLRSVPMARSGIVCGIAGALVGDKKQSGQDEGTPEHESGVGDTGAVAGGGGGNKGEEPTSVEMSYLSTAMAGTVMVAEEELERAVRALTDAQHRVGKERGGTSNVEAATKGVAAVNIKGALAKDW